MAWETSDRGSRLPPGWKSLRQAVMARDMGRCQECGNPATEVDHVSAGDDHSMDNLRAICSPCHRAKSSSEGAAGRNKELARLRAMTKRKPETPPGAIPKGQRKPTNPGW